MAVIRPFECVRPQAEKAERVAALPYDVYNREEACREVAREPLSFLKIDRAETQFDSSVDTYAPEVYAKAKELLENAIADGTFIKDSEQAYYIYELTMDGRVQTGLVACASIDDYESNVIKKHENTRADKELDRITHVDTCNAQTGPIFLAYRANAVINGEIDKAKKNSSLYNFVSPDGVRHQVWKISEPQSVKAIRGGEQIVETMDSKAKLKVKPGTQNNTKVRLRGKGFPVYKEEGKFGDMIVTYSIDIPTNLTDKQKELFREIQSLN